MNSLKFLVLHDNKIYHDILCVTFLPVQYFGLFVICQFDELNLLKIIKG